ncbi:MAG: hypothetical protein H8M99_02535 [Gloeobacteraceae cyanobacterium ES-bin-144]|nr:hypothetical protein [Verrucomicrobiales bacterium]
MSRITSIAISTGLIGSGVLAWTFAGRPLITNPSLEAPLNPLGINGSPYGEVFAMAIQGPIETFFHEGTSGGHHSHNKPANQKEDTAQKEDHHEHGDDCSTCKHEHEEAPVAKSSGPSLEKRFTNMLTALDEATIARTNPKSSSDAHKRYLRRQAEDKLRFAYQLDPTHYGNYNALHFFLTESSMGTRHELTSSVVKLAQETINICLKQEGDPRPTLTAAAAANNILLLMFEDQLNPTPKYTTAQMHEWFNVLDYSLARYNTIAKQWDESKNWERLSFQRILECQERLNFILKIKKSAELTIARLEGKQSAQASN